MRSGRADSAKQVDIDEALAEFCEGDFFGGWISSIEPSLYQAHKESNVSVQGSRLAMPVFAQPIPSGSSVTGRGPSQHLRGALMENLDRLWIWSMFPHESRCTMQDPRPATFHYGIRNAFDLGSFRRQTGRMPSGGAKRHAVLLEAHLR